MSDDLYLRTYTKSKDSLQWSNAESIGLWEWLKASAAFSRQVLPGGIVVERGQVWVSLRNLEDRLRLSRMTISRYLRLWSEDGAVEVQKLGRKGTIVTLCNFDTYQVLGREGGTQTSQKPAKSQPKASRNQPLTKNPKNPKNPKPNSAFVDWWAVWPKKTAKQAARNAYAKAVNAIRGRNDGPGGDDPEAFLLDRVTAFSGTPKANGDYCPNPATWLNDGRYDDDPATWGAAEKPAPETPAQVSRDAFLAGATK